MMSVRVLKLAGAAFVAAAMLAPAHAQYYRAPATPYYGEQYAGGAPDRDGYQRRGYDRRGYRDDREQPPPRRANNNRDRHGPHCNRGSVGTILGAIAGGLIGNAAVGRHGNQAAGTLAGAGAGALVGNAADRDCE